MKRKILDFLKQYPDYVSIEDLCAHLSIPAREIKQEIEQLISSGYEIFSTASGYKLNYHNDLLFPWEFPGMESLIHYAESANSTMELARELAKQGCPHQTIVIAGRQQQGRGRMTRHWDSAPGGLYFTLILRRGISMENAYLYNFASALSLREVFREWVSVPVMIKWPNDVLVDNKKVSGILLELGADSAGASYLNIGIGINVNNDPAPELAQAVSLKSITGRNIARKTILAAFIASFNSLTRELSQEKIIAQLKKYSATLGKNVGVHLPDGKTVSGKALDIEADGALKIMQENGVQTLVHFGDCIDHMNSITD